MFEYSSSYYTQGEALGKYSGSIGSSPKPLSNGGNDALMLNIWVSEYSFNSLWYKAYRDGLFNYTTTVAEVC